MRAAERRTCAITRTLAAADYGRVLDLARAAVAAGYPRLA
jgi:hypothetical protein